MEPRNRDDDANRGRRRREPEADEKRTAMWCHLSSLAGLVLPGLNILGPLFCWLSKKDESPFVNFHGKESLNFQINMLLYSLFCAPICCCGLGTVFVTGWDSTAQTVTWVGFLVGTALIGVLSIYEIVITVIAGAKASEGQWYRYHYVLFRLFK